MKKILISVFIAFLLAGCSSTEYTSENLTFEIGVSKDEVISKIKETIKAGGEQVTDKQLKNIEINFDDDHLEELGNFDAEINIDNQELLSTITLVDTTKPIITSYETITVPYNTELDNQDIIDLLHIELSDNYTSEDVLLNNFTFSNYFPENSGEQNVVIKTFDSSENETSKLVTITVENKPEPEIQYNHQYEQSNYSEPQGQTVWKSATGSKYHSIPNCGRMNPNKAVQITVEQALSQGLEACSKCY